MNINFDINAIIEMVAKGLGVASETVVQMYPQLLQEYHAYNLFNDIFMWLGFAVIVWVIGGIIYSINWAMEYEFSDEKYKAKWLWFLPLFFITYVGLRIGQIFLSPNMMLIMDLIEKTNK